VFTARYALSPYIKQIRYVFKGLKSVAAAAKEGRSLTELIVWKMSTEKNRYMWTGRQLTNPEGVEC
jgi:hypothetical protein